MVFAGGRATNGAYSINNDLTLLQVDNLSCGKDCFFATDVGNYAVFGAGAYMNSTFYPNVDIYDSSLTLTRGHDAREVNWNAAASTSNKAIFYGGSLKGNSAFNNWAEFFSEDLSYTYTATSSDREYHRGTRLGDKAIFGGGKNKAGAYLTTALVFGNSLTPQVITLLTVGVMHPLCGSNNKAAIFAGGSNGAYVDTVEAIDCETMTKYTLAPLDQPQYVGTSTTLEDYILIGGGSGSDTIISVYDGNLTKRDPLTLNTERDHYGDDAQSTSEYAIFCNAYRHVIEDIFKIVN